MENSGTNVTKIAMEFILVALFLMIAIKVIRLRDTYSEAYTRRRDVEIALDNSLEFGKYSGNKTASDTVYQVTGGDVLEALRNYRNGEVVIFVDKDKHGVSIKQDALNSLTHPELFTAEYLSGRIDLASLYYPYLVYDNAAVETKYGNTGLEVTGIMFKKK